MRVIINWLILLTGLAATVLAVGFIMTVRQMLVYSRPAERKTRLSSVNSVQSSFPASMQPVHK